MSWRGSGRTCRDAGCELDGTAAACLIPTPPPAAKPRAPIPHGWIPTVTRRQHALEVGGERLLYALLRFIESARQLYFVSEVRVVLVGIDKSPGGDMGRCGEMHQTQPVGVAELNVGRDECPWDGQERGACALEPCVSMHLRQPTDALGEDRRDVVIRLDQ
jgi:hypothetical protein